MGTTKELPFHLLLEKIKQGPFCEFSRVPSWDKKGLSCDCAGLITILLDNFQGEKSPNLKAYEYFELFEAQNPKTNIHELKRFDVLVWRKLTPPKSGDTGHILIITSRPKKLKDDHYEIKVLEVNRYNGLVERTIELTTFKDGKLKGVAWHPEKKKVKETEILGFELFKELKCSHCKQPQKICLCEYLPSKPQKAPPFKVFRHPDEKYHDLGTVNLLKLYYPELLVLDGTTFAPEKGVLVYPQTPGEPATMVTKVSENDPLIFLDATWKKSYRFLQENPWLKSLPRLEISGVSSNYRLRRPPQESSLNTLESFCQCLKLIGRNQEANEIESLFKKFISGKEGFVGKDKIEAYYGNRT